MAGHQDYAIQDGKVVTVFSAKGGVGKTTFSTNLGAYLASTGAKVLVVDLDLAFGDVAISLQLLPQNSMIDLVQMAGHLDEKGLESVVTRHESGLDAACAPAEPSDADRIPGHTVSELLKVAKRKYDFIVVDTPPAFTEHVLAAFDNSDLLVLIATLDIPAVKNLRLTLDTLDLLGSPKEDRVIVLNRSDAKVGLRSEDVVAVIKQEIAVMVPNSTAVPASVNRGVPIVLDEPKHPVSVAIRELAESFVRPVGTESRVEGRERRASDESTRRRILSWGGRR
jgi:pilus assembly protein CpaE